MRPWRSPLLLGLGFVLILPALADSANSWRKRPFADFLAGQGTTSMFVPPVPDYVGWVDDFFVTFALIDYAGLANEWIKSQTGGRDLRTTVYGTLRERATSDGRAEVRVTMETRDALAWAFLIADADFVNDPLPFLNTPLFFGARAQDVIEGAKPALARVSVEATFMNSAPGAPLPDLVQLLLAPEPGQVPYVLTFEAEACGRNRDGTPAVLRVVQDCRDDGAGQSCASGILEVLDEPRCKAYARED
jgi:hypothetical protein